MRLAILVLPFLAFGPLALAPGCEKDFEERVASEPGGRLEVDLDFGEGLRPDPGDLEIVSRAADEVWVRADASGWGASGVRFRVSQDGGRVTVDGGVSGTFSFLFGGPQVRVRIAVPRDFAVDVRSTTGALRIEDLRGEVRARTEAANVEVVAVEGRVRVRVGEGDVRVAEVVGDVDVRVGAGEVEMSWITGDVDVRSGGGELSLERVAGRLSARTDSGAIELREVAGAVEAKTERGNVFASFARQPGGQLETRRGSVEVQIPAETGADLDATSDRGVVLAGGLALPEQSGNHVAGPLNGGGDPLRLYTARGSVVVRAR